MVMLLVLNGTLRCSGGNRVLGILSSDQLFCLFRKSYQLFIFPLFISLQIVCNRGIRMCGGNCKCALIRILFVIVS